MIEEILLLANDAMVTLLSLLSQMDVLVQLLLRGERDSVHALQTIVGGLAEPVGSRVAHYFEALDQLGGRNVRSSAKIDKIATLVDSDALAILDLVADGLHLEWVVSEEVKSLLFGQDEPLELLILARDFLGSLLNNRVVLLGEDLKLTQKRNTVLVNTLIIKFVVGSKRYLCHIYIRKGTYIFASVAIIEETILSGRSVSKVHTELKLESLTKHVGARVPESLFAFGVRELEELDLAVAFQWARCVIIHPAFALLGLLLLWVL